MTVYFFPFPGGSDGKDSACNGWGNLDSIDELGRCPGEGNGYPLQYSVLENSTDYIVHGVTKNQTRLSDFQFPFTFTAISMFQVLFELFHISQNV